LGIPLNELYTRLQQFCVGQIQRELVGDRVALMEHVINRLDIPDLARIARLVTTALGEAPAEAEQYIHKIESDESRTEEQRELLLISLIINNNGSNVLRARVRQKARG
jgi:hypothetical protein